MEDDSSPRQPSQVHPFRIGPLTFVEFGLAWQLAAILGAYSALSPIGEWLATDFILLTRAFWTGVFQLLSPSTAVSNSILDYGTLAVILLFFLCYGALVKERLNGLLVSSLAFSCVVLLTYLVNGNFFSDYFGILYSAFEWSEPLSIAIDAAWAPIALVICSTSIIKDLFSKDGRGSMASRIVRSAAAALCVAYYLWIIYSISDPLVNHAAPNPRNYFEVVDVLARVVAFMAFGILVLLSSSPTLALKVFSEKLEIRRTRRHFYLHFALGIFFVFFQIFMFGPIHGYGLVGLVTLIYLLSAMAILYAATAVIRITLLIALFLLLGQISLLI